MPIIAKQGDLTQINCDAIVNPANSLGYMGGGVAGAIKNVGGVIIEKEAIGQAPIKIGRAVATSAGNLQNKYIIHAPTMRKPAMQIDIENVKLATNAALKLADELQLKTIAIPGMGSGVGGVSEKKAAMTMMSIVKKYQDKYPNGFLIEDIIKNLKEMKHYKDFSNEKSNRMRINYYLKNLSKKGLIDYNIQKRKVISFFHVQYK